MASSPTSKEASQSRPTRKRPSKSRIADPSKLANRPSHSSRLAHATASSSSLPIATRSSTRNVQSGSASNDVVVSQPPSSRPTYRAASRRRNATKRPAEDEDDRDGATRGPKRRRIGADAKVETETVAFDKREQDLLDREGAIKEREAAIEGREAALDQREAAIEKRETAVDKRESVAKKRADGIKKREIAVKQSEQALQKQRDAVAKDKEVTRATTSESKVRDLEARTLSLTKERDDYMLLWEKREYEREKTISSTAVNLQWILAHLEDSYQCSLCFETLAVSYAVNNGLCGHSFCASCILKWAFAALHRECGYWHEPLECPLCRASLPYTSEKTPRALCTIPFIPNRVADAAIEYFLDLLKAAATRPEGSYVNAADGELWYGQIDEKVVEWGVGKSARVEWVRRAKIGAREMKQMVSRWDTLGAEDFVDFKDRLATA
ncbi:hypothetical protein C8Q80DRAFT_1273797 [Daedaleopsis nitida]|nr:hypothetical protein C8Q80DRAFT_1273797 [Daedaleopsis nitida]